MKKQAWTAILLWMALFSFTLSAQGTGGTTTINLSESTNLTNGSYTIRATGKYHFKGTYSGTPSEKIIGSESQELGTAVISVAAGIEGDVTIILEDVTISLNENQQCPLSARNATGTVIVQLKGTNTLASTYSGDGGQCPALWAPETSGVELIIEKSSGTETGSLTATAEGTQYAPGIGSMSREGSQITINSGTIEAIGGANAAGIGGGPYATGGEITISGGKVTAKGGEYAAGIGGGNGGNGGTIILSGGEVKATGNYGGAGIGGGYGGAGGTITIEEGKVQATGGNWGAGIGGGNWGNGGKITITGGEVKATGSYGGAGIGGGNWGNGGKITITGGEVKATGSYGGAGIGGGYNGDGGTITITGGTVTATKGSNTATENAYDIKGNTVIVGPGATVKKDESGTNAVQYNGYTNGFVFSNNATSAEMKGTATLLADMTINASQTLTIQEGASLTIEEKVTLTNNGSITNKGTIYKRGAITNNQPTSSETGKIIDQTKLTKEMITIAEATYDGSQVKPTVTVSSYAENTDYTLDYDNNINAGTNATVTVTPTQTGSLYVDEGDAVTKTFTINPKPLSFTFSGLDSPITYDGNEHEATASANDLVAGDNVTPTLTYQKKGTDDTFSDITGKPTDAGTYKVTVSQISGEKASNYIISDNENDKSKEFTIAKATPNATDFTFTQPTDLTYNEHAKEATVAINAGITGMGETITIHYFKETGELSPAPTDAGVYNVKIDVNEGNNYTERNDLTADDWKFTIAKATPPHEAPTGLTAICGQTLADVTLPNGWAWMDKTTSVGDDIATKNFLAKYTPEDTQNYNVVENVQVSIKVVMEAHLSFAQPTLTITQGDAVPANALTKPEDCTVNYTSSEPTVATVDAATGMVTVVGVGTTTIKATALDGGNYTGEASYTLTVNSSIPPYIPPTPDPDPIYYTVTIPIEVAGAIIHGGGTHEVEEYTYCSFRIELDPNGNGEYPTVTKGYWWDTLTPDGQGNYSVYVTGNTQITIGEVPTNSYLYYQVTLPTDSVTEADDQYWSGDYIEVTGASSLRAAEEASLSYQAPFGTTVTLRPIETERRKFLQWEDGSKQKERTLTLRDDQEIKALWQRISPTGIEAIAAGSVIRGERGQLYIEVPEPCDVTLYTYSGVPVRVARLAAGANRLANLNAGLYLVKIGAAQAVPVRIR